MCTGCSFERRSNRCIALDLAPARCGGRRRRTLVAADLHFEKGSFYALSGQFLPPYDTRSTLKRLAALIARYQPRRVIALGDSFHDRDAANRLDDFERETLTASCREHRMDMDRGQSRSGAAGLVRPRAGRDRDPQSHLPPRALDLPRPRRGGGASAPLHTVSRRGQALRKRCFVSDGSRMVLPAFGAYAGGLDLWDPAIGSLFEADFAAYVLGKTRVYAVAGRGMPETSRGEASAPSAARNTSDDSQPNRTANSTAATP